MKTKVLLFSLTLWTFCMVGFSQPVVSIESLLKEMTDRDRIARYPEPSFTCKQFSSYDRESVAKDQPGWFANNDRSMFIRVENTNGRREFVMMDAEGPGAIVRFWSTISGEGCDFGTMRIYIDDDTKPAIEGNAFDILSGNAVAPAPFASSVSELNPYEWRGHNFYFPIPYAKRCKVTYESKSIYEDDFGAKRRESLAVYYNINYRTYDPATKVIPYSSAEMKKNKSLIDKTGKMLQSGGYDAGKTKLSRMDLNTTLRAGSKQSFTMKGPSAIRELSMKLQAADQEQALRSTILEITFDGEKTVWTPIGDFYGTGYRQLNTGNWYMQTGEDGPMTAWWIMPFEKECVITLHNLGSQQVNISEASAGYGKWKWDHRSMHFGSSWRQYTRILAGSKNLATDLNFATLKGKGVYAGDGVTLFNPTNDWWGEGDEKIYVDGEKFPSHFGTGTEDYYGYAWSRSAPFINHPYIAQPLSSNYIVNNRFRALDIIPFATSLVLDMELWHWGRTRMNYAPVTYWYILPGGKNMISEDLEGAKEKVASKRADIYPSKTNMYIEGEDLEPVSITGGHVQYQTHERWSEGAQLYLRDIKTGDKAEFRFECNYPGDYSLTGLLTIAPDYGKFNIYLNGQKIVNKLDLQNPEVMVREQDLGQITLVKGQNTLIIELAEFPAGQAICCFGLDKLYFRN